MSHSELPEEAVEAAARAMFAETGGMYITHGDWEKLADDMRDMWRAISRAGLTAALPHLPAYTVERELREALTEARKCVTVRRVQAQIDAALSRAPAPERTVGCVCRSCRREYQSDLIVPDDVWAQIGPSQMDGAKTGGLLCPSCIMERIVEKGIWTAGKAFDAHAERTVGVKALNPHPWQRALMWAYDRLSIDGGMTTHEQDVTRRELGAVLRGEPTIAGDYIPNEWDDSAALSAIAERL